MGAAMLAGVVWLERQYLLLAIVAVIALVFAAWRDGRLKTVITDDGISTRGVFGEKSLRWGEVSRVSGKGNEIKLHNFDGDVTLTPCAELPGYEEVIEIIGEKRPDLFTATRYPVMKKSMEYGVVLPLIALLNIALGGYIWSQADEFGTLPFIVFLVIGMVAFGFSAAAPQSVHVEKDALRVKYLTHEKTIPAADIRDVELAHWQSKNSRMYFVRLRLAGGESVRLLGLSPSLPIVRLVLKNWRGKRSSV